MSPIMAHCVHESFCFCSNTISLPGVSQSNLLQLRSTLEQGGVSRWLDTMHEAESLLAVLSTMGRGASAR